MRILYNQFFNKLAEEFHRCYPEAKTKDLKIPPYGYYNVLLATHLMQLHRKYFRHLTAEGTQDGLQPSQPFHHNPGRTGQVHTLKPHTFLAKNITFVEKQ